MRITGLKKYKYKYDLHVHTSPTSTCADFSPKETVKRYAEAGFDGFVLTNHFHLGEMGSLTDTKDYVNYYLDDYHKTKKEGKKAGLDILLGMEIRFPESTNDYLVYGLTEEDVVRASKYLDSDYKTFYRGFKSENNIIIQAHPFRNNIVLCDLNYIDGIEVFNMHPGHNARIGIAAKFAKENQQLLVTGGTDFHHEGHQGFCALCAEKKLSSSYDVSDVISSRNFVFDVFGNKIIPFQG